MERLTAIALAALLLAAGTCWGADDAARKRAVMRPTTDFSRLERYERLPAGAATSRKPADGDAFSHNSANMSPERELRFKVGNGLFRRAWVAAPASTRAADGLGPLFNARACQHCHLKDGRGHPPAAPWPEDDAVSMLLQIGLPPETDAQREALAAGKIGAIPDPAYGGQLQDLAVQGHRAEGHMRIDYVEQTVTLADGTVVRLRRPRYRVEGLAYGPLHPGAALSPRVAPQMIGLGLLQAIAPEDIRALADPEDRDGDGISGRARRVWSASAGRFMLGRFGLKAGKALLVDQAAGAFNADMGLSSPLHHASAGDCTARQPECLRGPHGGAGNADGLEVTPDILELVAFYAANLAVPARRRPAHPDVLAGKRIFYAAGCPACHTPKFVTSRDAPPEQAWQLIWPYTDLLLHDMGEGLADHRVESGAGGTEWRTAPLWGIGLTETVSGHSCLLHDGRARGLLEAILWHDGEAAAARRRVVKLSGPDRARLLAFLNSL